MNSSIKRSVSIRVICAVIMILLFSSMTTMNIIKIDRLQEKSILADSMLNQIQRAEAAHYKWSLNLSNALYAGSEFTGSMDHTSCVLGKWLYAEMELEDESVEKLRSEIEVLHKELHGSAATALDLYANEASEAQEYYQGTIQPNLANLVGLLDEVVERGEALSADCTSRMNRTISFMHISTALCLVLALISLISLVLYVQKQVIRPLISVTMKTRPLKEGHLSLEFDYHSQNELGELVQTLEESMGRIQKYVGDIDRIMGELAQGNFDVNTSVRYIGDFRSIEEALNNFTDSISRAMGGIIQAQQNVSAHAESLSGSAQTLAQGATDQAGAVEELYATVDELSGSAARNAEAISDARNNAGLTSEQVKLSSTQMEKMVAAMGDISQASQQIGRIIATIEEIASQTNLLALNATVEAARVGEIGKGFAVVASEVGLLASKSDEAVKATKALIDNSVRATEHGSQIVEEVFSSLRQAQELVLQSDASIHSIAEAIELEAETLAQVTLGIGQISDVVQSNSASSQESAAVSVELFEQVHLLEEETKRFQLKKV